MRFYFSFPIANMESHQAEDSQELSWTISKKDAGQKIPPKVSCLKLSIYTSYFKAIFKKNTLSWLWRQQVYVRQIFIRWLWIKGALCIPYPSEQLPWPVTSFCCSSGLKFILVQTGAKKMEEAHYWCSKLCSKQISFQGYAMSTFMTLIDRPQTCLCTESWINCGGQLTR